MTRGAFAVAVGLLFAVPMAARADAVGPPPTSCPTGGVGATCHGLEYCAIDGCIGPADCAPGEVCAARELCIGTGMCFGRGGGTPVSIVLGDCDDGCARCESQFVCAPGAPARDAGRPDAGARDAGRMDAGSTDGRRLVRYCGCAVPSPREPVPSFVVVVLAGLFLALAARR